MTNVRALNLRSNPLRIANEYTNAHTGAEIALNELSRSQKEFYSEAFELFRRNTSWIEFEEFAFGSRSPLYENSDSHVDVLKDPLYLALEDMRLELGVQEGATKRRGPRDERRGERTRSLRTMPKLQ
ncbi:MAG TPA: hypothetical protein VGJ81_19470 [Thermoanaerobaculia bacterium]|jgi:hypothetical protein